MSELDKSHYTLPGSNNLKPEQIIHGYKPNIFQIIGFGFLGLILFIISLLILIIGINIVLNPDINANLINMGLTIGLGSIFILLSIKFFAEPLTSRILIMEDEIRIKRFFRVTTVPLKHISAITIVYSNPFLRKHKEARLRRLILLSKARIIASIILNAYSISQRYEIKELLLRKIRKVSKVTINKEYVNEFPPIYL